MLPIMIKVIKTATIAGQVVFISEQSIKYFGIENRLAYSALSALTAMSTASVLLICKSPAINRTFSSPRLLCSTQASPQAAETPMSFPGKVAYAVLSASGVMAGVFDSLYGYLGANILMEWLTKQLPLNETMAEGCVITGSLLGLVGAGACFAVYDFREVLHKNAKKIGAHFHPNQIPLNKAMLQTVAVGLVVTGITSSQTVFTTPEALRSLGFHFSPGIEKFLAEGAGALTGIATTGLWCSIYEAANGEGLDAQQRVYDADEETYLMTLCRYFIYAAGGIDSVCNTGLNIFLSVVVTLNVVFDMDLYSAFSIGLGIAAGISAAVLNAAAAVRPGYLDRMELLYAMDHEPLLDEEDVPEITNEILPPPACFNKANQIGLLFQQGYVRA